MNGTAGPPTPAPSLAPGPPAGGPGEGMAAGTGGATRYMVQWDEHPGHLASRLGHLLEHQSLVDVTLMCNTHTLKVHRAVLAACSPYFETVLQRQLGTHPLIVLKDMKFCVLKSLVEFMYCGETSVTTENLNPLMEAAKFFEVKGLSTMTKDFFNKDRGSAIKKESSTSISGSYRGRGRRGGRGRYIPTPGKPTAPQETAQIMLSLSEGGDSTQSPQQPATLHNGRMDSSDLKTLQERLDIGIRRRGRGRGVGRGRIRDLIESKLGLQAIKKEDGDTPSQSDQEPSDRFAEPGQSPLLASLLSKAEAEIKTEHAGGGREEEIVYRYEGGTDSATKYLDALRSAGLPTDVPVLIDAGDGTYVSMTEDVLRRVLGDSDEFQFQVTEATLGPGNSVEAGEGGTVAVTSGRHGPGGAAPMLTMGKRSVSIKGIKSRAPSADDVKPSFVTSEASLTTPTPTVTPVKPTPSPAFVGEKKETPVEKSVEELINEAMMESLRNGAANEAETDPEAVVLFEVTDDDKVCKYVVSSKEISALKALNEQIERKKNQNSPVGKKSPPLPTVVDGNTNIAELHLALPKNSRKSIVSEVLARAHSLESQLSGRVGPNSPVEPTDETSCGNSDPGSAINCKTLLGACITMLGSVDSDLPVDPEDSQPLRINESLDDGKKVDIDLTGRDENLLGRESVDFKLSGRIEHQPCGQRADINLSGTIGSLLVGESAHIKLFGREESLLSEERAVVRLSGRNESLSGEQSTHVKLSGREESLSSGESTNVKQYGREENLLGGERTHVKLSGREESLLSGESTDVKLYGREESLLGGENTHVKLSGKEESLLGGERDDVKLFSREESLLGGESADVKLSNRDMPLLDIESESVRLPLIDNNGEKTQPYGAEDLNGFGDTGRDKNELIGLLNAVRDEASRNRSSEKENLIPDHSDYTVSERDRSAERSVLDEVEKLGELLVDGKCRDLSVEQALQEMMGEGGAFDFAPTDRITENGHGEINRIEGLEVLESTPEEAPEKSTNGAGSGMMNGGMITSQGLESCLVSPAVIAPPLLPATLSPIDAFETENDRPMRKTRSGGMYKRESVGTKRRSSGESSKRAVSKRRKSTEAEGVIRNGTGAERDWVPKL